MSTDRADASFSVAARRYENATPPDGYDDDVPLHERVECSSEELPEVLRAIADRWRDGHAARLPTGVSVLGGVSGACWWCAAHMGALAARVEATTDWCLDELAADALDALAREVARTVRR